ncbi:MAG: hypothetical protein IK025_13440, partial [Bacteroidales bacterium]|nr:hypothetical protein [Bacteroidales bacterium]
MMNVKDFTDAEFLSFLYSEKSREIENNAVPGWNKWAIYGTIATTVIYLYYAITNNYKNYDYRIFSMYIIGLSAIFLYLLIYKRLNSDVKTYIQSKVRPLIKEAPILLYVFQLIINSVLALIQFYWNSLSVIFFGIIIALIINVFILIYIIKNRNKFVLAKLKIQVLNNLKIDVLVHSFLGGIYTLIIVTTLIYLIKEPKSFYHSEFELAFGITTLTILIYLLLKIIKKNNNVSDELDRLINKFVIGSISKEEAYNKYILIMYGLSAYQAIEKDLEIIN